MAEAVVADGQVQRNRKAVRIFLNNYKNTVPKTRNLDMKGILYTNLVISLDMARDDDGIYKYNPEDYGDDENNPTVGVNQLGVENALRTNRIRQFLLFSQIDNKPDNATKRKIILDALNFAKVNSDADTIRYLLSRAASLGLTHDLISRRVVDRSLMRRELHIIKLFYPLIVLKSSVDMLEYAYEAGRLDVMDYILDIFSFSSPTQQSTLKSYYDRAWTDKLISAGVMLRMRSKAGIDVAEYVRQKFAADLPEDSQQRYFVLNVLPTLSEAGTGRFVLISDMLRGVPELVHRHATDIYVHFLSQNKHGAWSTIKNFGDPPLHTFVRLLRPQEAMKITNLAALRAGVDEDEKIFMPAVGEAIFDTNVPDDTNRFTPQRAEVAWYCITDGNVSISRREDVFLKNAVQREIHADNLPMYLQRREQAYTSGRMDHKLAIELCRLAGEAGNVRAVLLLQERFMSPPHQDASFLQVMRALDHNKVAQKNYARDYDYSKQIVGDLFYDLPRLAVYNEKAAFEVYLQTTNKNAVAMFNINRCIVDNLYVRSLPYARFLYAIYFDKEDDVDVHAELSSIPDDPGYYTAIVKNCLYMQKGKLLDSYLNTVEMAPYFSLVHYAEMFDVFTRDIFITSLRFILLFEVPIFGIEHATKFKLLTNLPWFEQRMAYARVRAAVTDGNSLYRSATSFVKDFLLISELNLDYEKLNVCAWNDLLDEIHVNRHFLLYDYSLCVELFMKLVEIKYDAAGVPHGFVEMKEHTQLLSNIVSCVLIVMREDADDDGDQYAYDILKNMLTEYNGVHIMNLFLEIVAEKTQTGAPSSAVGPPFVYPPPLVRALEEVTRKNEDGVSLIDESMENSEQPAFLPIQPALQPPPPQPKEKRSAPGEDAAGAEDEQLQRARKKQRVEEMQRRFAALVNNCVFRVGSRAALCK